MGLALALCALGLPTLACEGGERLPDGGWGEDSGGPSAHLHLVVLPDTQCYALLYPEIFAAQGDWIADSAATVGGVIHLGDITETNAPAEWEVARSALAPLYPRMAMALAPGNHDLGEGGSARDRTTRMQDAFPISMVSAAPGFVAAFDDAPTNTAWRVEGREQDVLLIALEFSPRAAVRAWARDILAAHPEHLAILSTHAYLDGEGRRYDHANPPAQEFCPHDYAVTALDGSDGEQLFREVIEPSTNVRLVLSGHVPNGFAHSVDRNARGDLVHQLVVDYQTGTRCPEEGGDGRGFLLDVTLEERAEGTLARVRSFSPFTGEERPEHALALELDPI